MTRLTVEEIEEEIAKEIGRQIYELGWGPHEAAKAILSIGGIRELLELRDAGKLAEILNDQTELYATGFGDIVRVKRLVS